MRLRNVQGSYERLENHKMVIKNPKEQKGNWKKLFGNNNPIHIEIGMGKGKFIINHAKNNKDINFIGIEKYTSVLARALDKVDKEKELENLLLIRVDIEEILDIFDKEEIGRIYLNFSDPWPKERHGKRRLTHRGFLEKYNTVLEKNSNVIFKTDNKDLFEFSLEQIKEFGMKIDEYTYDLHTSPYVENNIMTEYEEKFVKEGMKICMVNAKKTPIM